MKKVKFLTSVSSADGAFAGGEIAYLGDVLAVQWAGAGLVHIIEERPQAQAAAPAAVPVGTATNTRRRK